MRGIRHISVALAIIAVIFFLGLSFTTAFASGQGGQTPTADHAISAVDGHSADTQTETHASSNSLSRKKLIDLGYRILNFAFLVAGLIYVGAKPIGNIFLTRRKRIKKEIETLTLKRVEAEKSYSEFQAKLANVESEIDEIIERALAQAKIEKEKIFARAEQAAKDLKNTAETAVQNEIAQAQRMLKDEIAEQAAAMAEGLIRENLTVNDQVKIIDNYLAKVGTVQ